MLFGNRRIAREKKTVGVMIAMHCHATHATSGKPCAQCQGLLDYALKRLDACPYGPRKPACSHCPVHCYKPDMREGVRAAMRYAGPRMPARHPILALWHAIDGRRKCPGSLAEDNEFRRS